MTLENIPTDLQELIILDYEFQVKIILLAGWWFFALIYLLYWYPKQQPTKLFLVGTFRGVMYIMSFLYVWLFWLLFPVYLHPNVPIDNLLLFLAYSYTGLSTVFLVMFIFNFTLWIPKFILKFGKWDITGFEDNAIKEYFGSFSNGWKKKKR